jgi:hypothetical protein
MQEIMITIKLMEKEKKLVLLMEHLTKEILRMGKNMEMENITKLTESIIKESGRIIYIKDK